MAGRLLSNLGLRSRARSPVYQDLPDFGVRDSQEHTPAQKGLVSLLAYRFMKSARWSILVLVVVIGLAYLSTVRTTAPIRFRLELTRSRRVTSPPRPPYFQHGA